MVVLPKTKIILTRYSILDSSIVGIRNKDITSQERLSFKLKIFTKITLPSVLNQSESNWKWFIYAGSFLKGTRIEDIVKIDSRITIRFVDTYREFINQADFDVGDNTSIRLDDDDGISHGLLKKLDQYQDRDIVSFPNGEKFNFKFKKKDHYQRNIAIGLARIKGNIYRCGNHGSIHKRYNVIYDESPKMYLLCCSKHCDTKRRF